MQFNFIKCPFDDPERIAAAEEVMEKMSAGGWHLHSWHPIETGGFVALMVRAPQPGEGDSITGMPVLGRSPRLGQQTAADPTGGPEKRTPVPSGKSESRSEQC